MDYCDYNNDGTVSICEVHDCIIDCENAWRDEYCPESEHLFCYNPYDYPEGPCPTCYGAWTCDEIYTITE